MRGTRLKSRLRFTGAAWALLASLQFALAAESRPAIPPAFEVVPGSSWEKAAQPMPGVEVAYFRKGTGEKRPNIAVLRDKTADAYASLDDYLKAALQVLKEQGAQEVLAVREAKSKGAGEFRIVHSRKADSELVQGIYFKKGRGFYVVTALAPKAEFEKLAGEFERVLKNARFP